MTAIPDRSEIGKLILDAQKKALRAAQEVRTRVPLDREFLKAALRRYILSKYLLDEGETQSEGLDELTELSLARSLKISRDLVREFDMAKNCSGGTSAMTKKALLFMAIQRDFDVYLPTEGIGEAKTVSDLADLVWEAMCERDYWRPYLKE